MNLQKQTLYQITEEFPETIPLFVSSGFEQMRDDALRESFGNRIDLQTALNLKKIDEGSFLKKLNEIISAEEDQEDLTLRQKQSNTKDTKALRLSGLLPCPVRIPLMEAFNGFLKKTEDTHALKVNASLQAASMGLDWLREELGDLSSADDLPDMFISAGFDMFFGDELFGQFKHRNIFKDLIPSGEINHDFDDLKLVDPKGNYSVISVVPAVFLVNTQELGDLPAPESWEDILKPEFKGRVSLPVSDFDLFNAILLNIQKIYGDEGVIKLGQSLSQSMHPAQMLKTEKAKTARPAVTIMPYFFTKMVKPGTVMQAVWPKDGAILSPIFMLSKAEKKKELQPLVDLFASKEIGDILSVQGLFPSLHPEVENPIPEQHPFMWLGWDYIYEQDIQNKIQYCMELFAKGEQQNEAG